MRWLDTDIHVSDIGPDETRRECLLTDLQGRRGSRP